MLIFSEIYLWASLNKFPKNGKPCKFEKQHATLGLHNLFIQITL